MARDLTNDPEDLDLAGKYYTAALAGYQIHQAEKTFVDILERFPNNQPIRRLYVACCLQQTKYDHAMEAIEILIAFSKPEDALIDSALQVREKIGCKKIRKNTEATTLSLCMIAKNEQSFLGPCLNAAKSLADEIIVVDTGSKDRTADIARIFGARVYDFDWQDDFSAARNAALDKASGEWILLIDADEIIAREDFPLLKTVISNHQNRTTAFSLETRNYTHNANYLNWHANDGRYPLYETGLGWFPSYKIRLFPNLPEIRFQYPVHELVDPTIKSAGLQIEDGTVPIHHYGHLNEKKNRRKAENYFKIGYAKLHQLGEDVGALRELAVQAGQLEYWSESLALWQRLLKIRPDYIEAFVNQSGALWQLGRYEEALQAARKALLLNPDLKEAGYNYAVSLLLLGQAQKAVETLKKLCQKHPDYLGAQFMLASSYACTGDFGAARNGFHKLETVIHSDALVIGIHDLVKRLQANRCFNYSDQLNHVLNRINPNVA